MKLEVNGELHEHSGNGSISALLDELGAKKEHAALTVNGDIVSSSRWEEPLLQEGDKVEILVFVGGG